MRTGLVTIPSAWETDWIPLDTIRDGNVGGPAWKLLSKDEETGACSYLMHMPPNWHDEVLDYHPGVEEAYVLAGVSTMGEADQGGTRLEVGDYCYRPPGILHGPARIPSINGATFFQRMSSELRILRYDGDEFPHENFQPITDEYKTHPVTWAEKTSTDDLPWETSTGGWTGARHKWVWRNTETGGGCVILDLPAGWQGTGSPAIGSIEEFVLEGGMQAGGVEYRSWGYAHRPPGQPAGRYSTLEGARLLCYWDESNELVEDAA
jgi:hypothetical protein